MSSPVQYLFLIGTVVLMTALIQGTGEVESVAMEDSFDLEAIEDPSFFDIIVNIFSAIGDFTLFVISLMTIDFGDTPWYLKYLPIAVVAGGLGAYLADLIRGR